MKVTIGHGGENYGIIGWNVRIKKEMGERDIGKPSEKPKHHQVGLLVEAESRLVEVQSMTASMMLLRMLGRQGRE